MNKFFKNFKLTQYGYQYLKDNVTTVHLCIDPLGSDSLATIATKSIASSAFGSGDVSFSNDGTNFFTDLNGKSIDPTSTAAGTDDIAVVYVDGTEVLLMLDAADRVITNETGDIVAIAAGRVETPPLAEKVV